MALYSYALSEQAPDVLRLGSKMPNLEGAAKACRYRMFHRMFYAASSATTSWRSRPTSGS